MFLRALLAFLLVPVVVAGIVPFRNKHETTSRY